MVTRLTWIWLGWNQAVGSLCSILKVLEEYQFLCSFPLLVEFDSCKYRTEIPFPFCLSAVLVTTHIAWLLAPFYTFTASNGGWGLPNGASGKEPFCQCRRHKRCRFDPRVQKIPWRRKWQPTPLSCLENPMDRRARCATVHGVADLDTNKRRQSPPGDTPRAYRSGDQRGAHCWDS